MSRGKKRRGEPIDGVLLLDKQQGITSNKALQQCRYLINAQKGGHTGALDPLATGLLPLCFGQATKVSSFLLDTDKTYAVTATLGKITDTGDADGEVIETTPVKLQEQDIRSACEKYIGEYDQVPPMYSALKVNGQPLYKLARQGITIERKARRVSAFDIRY
ncbi:MAG: tRNA pseudouridine(55) synthase TruB, partial [Proteobacteria bacterium]|nr:tRNA pseudouridine(55) synthase TruB [Pseudomonadota bacterium]